VVTRAQVDTAVYPYKSKASGGLSVDTIL